jgi:hypothetical protein
MVVLVHWKPHRIGLDSGNHMCSLKFDWVIAWFKPIKTSMGFNTININRIENFHLWSQTITLVYALPLWKFSWGHITTTTIDGFVLIIQGSICLSFERYHIIAFSLWFASKYDGILRVCTYSRTNKEAISNYNIKIKLDLSWWGTRKEWVGTGWFKVDVKLLLVPKV